MPSAGPVTIFLQGMHSQHNMQAVVQMALLFPQGAHVHHMLCIVAHLWTIKL